MFAVTSPGGASAQAGNELNPDSQIYLTYQGDLTRITWLGTGSTGHNFGKLSVTLEWQASVHFPDQGSFSRGVDIDYTTLKGTIDLDDKGDPTPQTSGLKSCNAKLSERLSGYEQTATTEYDLATRLYEMNLYLPPLTASLLKSTDTSGDYCTVDPSRSSAVGLELDEWPGPLTSDPQYENAWAEYEKFPGGHGPFVSTFADNWSRPHPGGDQTDVANITDTVTASDVKLALSGPEPTGAGPYLTKRMKGEIKVFFGNDIKAGVDAAKPYCLAYLSGVGTFGTGVLLLGSGTVGPVLVIAGALVAFLAEPFCDATIKRVDDDYRIVKDPPGTDLDQVATPASVSGVKFESCNKYKVSVRPECQALTADAEGLIVAARRLSAVADAATVTMDRYSTVTAASNWAASKTQGQQLELLTRDDTQAIAAIDVAGGRFAKAILGLHIDWRFTAPDAGRAIDAVLSLLEKLQLTRGEIAPYAGSSLTPQAFDVLSDQNAL